MMNAYKGMTTMKEAFEAVPEVTSADLMREKRRKVDEIMARRVCDYSLEGRAEANGSLARLREALARKEEANK